MRGRGELLEVLLEVVGRLGDARVDFGLVEALLGDEDGDDGAFCGP